MRRTASALLFALLIVAAAACGSGSKRETCAANTEPIYRTQAQTSPWPLYCPGFLPKGAAIDHADYGASLSTLWFSLDDNQTLQIIQGHILIAPRTADGFAQAERDVPFGDVPAQLFMAADGPMVRSAAEEDVTRAILSSSGIDADVVVKIAKGMRRVDAALD